MTRNTYADTGVNYDAMDPFKRAAQLAARETAENIRRANLAGGNFSEVEGSRGESVYLIDGPGYYLAHVEEGLGTKNRVADDMAFFGSVRSYYDNLAQDTVAMIVNDMITLGAMPLSVAMHLAVGSSNWFENEQRSNDLIAGWKKACDLAGCTWGGGETPTLKGVVMEGTAVLSGSAMGIVAPKGRLIRGNIKHDDSIVFVTSSGIHANGLTWARDIASRLPDHYETQLENGRTYGETLLDPTTIYVKLVDACLEAGVDIHYAVNITGHGWRKLMRANQPFTYVITKLPPQLPIFDFLQKEGNIDDREMYSTFNMGAGFALYVPARYTDAVLGIAEEHGYDAFLAGYIERGEKKVIIEPNCLEFAGETLAVR